MSHDPLGVGTIEAVSLAELVATADLQVRRDRKYVVPTADLPRLVADGAGGARVLDIDHLRTFRYESVYFDTPDLNSYLSAARRRPNRFKVRTRSYLDSGDCMLEIKTRDASGRTVKHRTPHDMCRRSDLTDPARVFIAGIPAAATAAPHLRLALSTRYRRTTLVMAGSAARVTIDTDLEWFAADGRRQELRGLALVETKTTGAACSFDRCLWRSGVRPVVISKYCTGMAALAPELPANKWNRSLRQFFGWAPARAHDIPRSASIGERSRLAVDDETLGDGPWTELGLPRHCAHAMPTALVTGASGAIGLETGRQ